MSQAIRAPMAADGLADILERVLDKGVVIAGDVSIHLVGVELLTIKLRLLIASVDKAKEMGIDWWQSDPMLSSHASQHGSQHVSRLEQENRMLRERMAEIEARLAGLSALGEDRT
ncbi:hypothetical protein M2322_004613 [Rhodoblastus acidophilus]|uniref:gas vesicle protein n=1 Tax=Rhodoblastus acidophilus TaxID=1074 RepID=UPI0022243B02|nr:gas vesicle protein [Rhodoblastus acidophilus]MCW2319044.1 hypothetical protein [Rhodoblastus acidophilus]